MFDEIDFEFYVTVPDLISCKNAKKTIDPDRKV